MRAAVIPAFALASVLLIGCGGTATSGTSASTSPSVTSTTARAPAASVPVVPPDERTRIRVFLAPVAYLPSSLPASFIFIDWKHSNLNVVAFGQLLTVDFAAPGGRQIVWTSSRANYNGQLHGAAKGYPAYGFFMTPDKSAVINGREVYYSGGNRGANAWTSFPIQTTHGVDYAAVGLWEDQCLTPLQAMRLVAFAVPA
jgi:hypothetical protein